MSASIISIDRIRSIARAAHAAGAGRDDHNMNWHVPAIEHWQAEWDRCEQEKQERGV